MRLVIFLPVAEGDEMPDLELSMIGSGGDVVDPIFDGEIKPEGISLTVTRADGSTGYWRQFNFEEFDVATLSCASYIIAKTHGYDAVALPVFSSRRFMHTELRYHTDSGVQTAADLKGKRLGVPEYQMTAAVWTRGVLEHDFGVSQYDIHWYMERSEEFSHGGSTGFQPPEGISFTRLPNDKSMAMMLVNNEVDAASLAQMDIAGGNLIDRSTQMRAQDGDWSKIKKLFPDLIAEGTRFYEKYGFIPATQMFTIRRSTYEKYPWIAFNLYEAFLKSKRAAEASLNSRIPALMIFGRDYMARTRKIFGSDPYAYGVQANRPMLTTLIDLLHEQQLITEKPQVEDLFAPSVAGL
jgi:4,5-dihydroxyphthalate decarboxylase